MANIHAQSNGAEQTPNAGSLKVVIVGAGIAGLTTAVALRQQGHEVHVYEQSQLADEIGAAIHMSPNATSVLRKLGIDVAARGGTKLLLTRYYNAAGQLLSSVDNAAESERWQDVWLQAHRGHLHTQLKEAATSTQPAGIPVRVYTSSRISKVDPYNASITLANGEIAKGDVLIGADGVRSVARRAVAGPEYESFEIGKNAFRFMVPLKKVLTDPDTRALGEVPGSMDLIFSDEHKVIMYQCVHGTLLNIVCIHPARQSDASAETYNNLVSMETVLEIFREFNPKLLKLFKMCDSDSLKVYPLFDAKTMPTFIKDRLALIGDAAHPFTPFIGQGGATAIEDAVSLGVMLTRDTTRAEVPERLQLYEKARLERANRIQGYSRMAGGDGVKPGEEKAARMKGLEHAFYSLSHDEIHASTQILRQHRWSKIKNARWRHPTVFGPMPSPILVTGSPSRVRTVTARIKFKTSGTLLRNLIPNEFYSFASKDTVAVASLTLVSHRNVEWLGNHGFDCVLLEFHGIDYTKADGTVVSGRYLPIMFENSADVISAGREDVAYPSVFSDIGVAETDDESFQADMSWKGIRWATIWLKDLKSATRQESMTEKGVLVHRYMPAVTDEAPAGAGAGAIEEDILIVEDPVVHAANGEGTTTSGGPTSHKTLSFKSSRRAGFTINPHNQKELPTLYHIVSRLAELPIFDVVSATVCEEEGPTRVVKAFRVG